jgi:hypothetical protein
VESSQGIDPGSRSASVPAVVADYVIVRLLGEGNHGR